MRFLYNVISFIRRGGFLFFLLCIALFLSRRTGYISIIAFFSILIFPKVRKLDKTAGLLLVYLLFYLLFSFFNGFSYDLSTLVLYGVAPLIFYFYGNQITRQYKNDYDFIWVWYIIVLCYCLDVFFVTISDIVSTGQIIALERSLDIVDDNAGEIKINATQLGLAMDIGMIGLPMCVLVKKKILRIAFFVLFFFSLLTTFHLLNRTGIIVAIICFIGVMFYYSRKNTKLLFNSVFFIFVVYFVLVFTGILNEELIELYSNRNEDISTMGSRTERWSDAIGNLFLYPLGWTKGPKDLHYVHNMWLDIAKISGIVPFLILLYLSVKSFIVSLKLVKRFNNNSSYMLLGLNICFGASCFVEPIYGGTHFLLYCLLWGCQNSIYNNSSKLK